MQRLHDSEINPLRVRLPRVVGTPVITTCILPGWEVSRMDWNGQVAVVTGGSRGIGAAITRRLAARGAAVGINYMARAVEAETLRAEIVAAGGRAAALQADIADPAAVEAMFAQVESALGPVSILVNNAGVSTPATLESYDGVALERMRAVNVNGVIHTVRAVMAGMKSRGYGRIVNIASNAAIGTALAGTTFYAATKAEVLILTRRFAMELGRGAAAPAPRPTTRRPDCRLIGAARHRLASRNSALSSRSGKARHSECRIIGRHCWEPPLGTPRLYA